MKTFTVHLARTGTCQEVTADNWQTALKATGRPDACLVEAQPDGAIDTTFDPDAPTIITTRLRQGTDAECVAFALTCVTFSLDAEQAGGAA